MPNPFERVFRPNLEDDAVFDAQVKKAVIRAIDQNGVNRIGIRLAYEQASQLNERRKTPQHKNYVLNVIREAAVSSHRFDTDGLLNKNILEDLRDYIEELKREA